MKRLILGLAAGLFVVATALTASAGMAGSSYYHQLDAIDSSGHSVLTVQSPSSPIPYTVSDRIYLDSNKVWEVKDVSITSGSMTAGSGSKGASHLYCFDSTSRFCANAY